MICILGEKWRIKKEQRYICLNLVTFIVLIIFGYFVVRSSRYYSSQNFNIFFFFWGGGFIPLNTVGGNN